MMRKMRLWLLTAANCCIYLQQNWESIRTDIDNLLLKWAHASHVSTAHAVLTRPNFGSVDRTLDTRIRHVFAHKTATFLGPNNFLHKIDIRSHIRDIHHRDMVLPSSYVCGFFVAAFRQVVACWAHCWVHSNHKFGSEI